MKCIYLKSDKEFDSSKDNFDIKSFKHCDYTELLKSLVFLRDKILKDFEYQIERKNYQYEFSISDGSLFLDVWKEEKKDFLGFHLPFLGYKKNFIYSNVLASPVLDYVHKEIGMEMSKTLLISSFMIDKYLHCYSTEIAIREFELKYFILCNTLNKNMNLFNSVSPGEICSHLFFPNINVSEFSSIYNFIVNVVKVSNNEVVLSVENRKTPNEFILLKYDETDKYEKFVLDAITKLESSKSIFAFTDNRYLIWNGQYTGGLCLDDKYLKMTTFSGSIYIYVLSNSKWVTYILDQESFDIKIKDNNPYNYSFELFDSNNSCIINCGIETLRTALKEINYGKDLPNC